MTLAIDNIEFYGNFVDLDGVKVNKVPIKFCFSFASVVDLLDGRLSKWAGSSLHNRDLVTLHCVSSAHRTQRSVLIRTIRLVCGTMLADLVNVTDADYCSIKRSEA